MKKFDKRKTLLDMKRFLRSNRDLRKENTILQNLTYAKKLYAFSLLDEGFLAISTKPYISRFNADTDSKDYYSTFYFVATIDND